MELSLPGRPEDHNTSPHCSGALKRLRGTRRRMEVIHYTEILCGWRRRENRPEREFRQENSLSRPCYLGRHSGIYDARGNCSRGSGHRDKRTQRSRDSSLCCAGAAGASGGSPDGRAVRRTPGCRCDRFGAQVLATSCPYCVNMMTDACNSMEKQDVLEIKELSEILAESL